MAHPHSPTSAGDHAVDSTAKNQADHHAANTRAAHRVTLIGAGIDFVVGMFKLVAGLMVGSAALVADGIHSFSDILTDIFVIGATHFGRQAPDSGHPYGHGRIETLATLWLGSILIFVAGAIAWASLERLFSGTPVLAPGPWAIGIAVVALLAKEWIYRYTMKIAKQVGSKLLEANAWHSRSDALSTVVVLVGLLGAQLGAGWLDGAAAVVVAIMVGKIGGSLLWEASQELIDTALPASDQQRMRETAEQVPGVRGVHDLRTRTVGGQILLDLHLVVHPRVTVSEAHEVGNEVCRQLHHLFPDLSDVTFHIDPEDDQHAPPQSPLHALPLREEVETELAKAWSGLAAWESCLTLDLHYLDQRIDVSLYVQQLQPEVNLDEAADSLRKHAAGLPWIGRLRIWQGPGKA
ncbi:cation diffusion facilitator family transporter [Halomonas sp. I5-271120]|uniref:cation diffusion facilitator family transporter n=1 Tax=Halomonas sp. I5-271120 TaxID=3061632 RepID=UPI002714DA70|nr:cation diffusion facilitator family transporter [Halomonas sp. I5-271120]